MSDEPPAPSRSGKRRSKSKGTGIRPQDVQYLALLAEELEAAEQEADLSREEMRAMVYRLITAGRLQRGATEIAEQVVEGLTPSVALVEPIPPATFNQALLQAARRRELLETGVYTVAGLAHTKDSTEAAIRQWIRRARIANRLFTVSSHGQTLIPANVLTEELGVRPELAEPIATLRSAGLDGWALWNWLSQPNSWLDGSPPFELLSDAPEQVGEAARRWASNIPPVESRT